MKYWKKRLLGNLWKAAATKKGWFFGILLMSSALFAVLFGMGYSKSKWGKK